MRRRLAAVLLVAAPSLAAAQSSGTPPPTSAAPSVRPPACSSQEHRQFDFWLGDWVVEGPKGPAGKNRISALYGACGLREEYSTPTGYVGSSFNLYDAPRKVWHQTWVDNQGALLVLEGGLRDGRMVLEGRRPGASGVEQLNRITWTPNADASVRQHWEISVDEGRNWTTAFDGLYRKLKSGEAFGKE